MEKNAIKKMKRQESILWVVDTHSSATESFIFRGWVLLEHFGNFTLLKANTALQDISGSFWDVKNQRVEIFK